MTKSQEAPGTQDDICLQNLHALNIGCLLLHCGFREQDHGAPRGLLGEAHKDPRIEARACIKDTIPPSPLDPAESSQQEVSWVPGTPHPSLQFLHNCTLDEISAVQISPWKEQYHVLKTKQNSYSEDTRRIWAILCSSADTSRILIAYVWIAPLGTVLLLHTHTHTHTHMYIHTYIHIYMYMYMYIYMYIYFQNQLL